MVIFLLADDFRAHVVRCPQWQFELFVAREEMTSKAKIRQLHLNTAVGQISAQDIFQLDIPMRYLLRRVHVIEREEYLVYYFSGLVFCKATHFCELVEEVASTDELCHYEVTFTVLHQLEHSHDIRVRRLLKHL